MSATALVAGVGPGLGAALTTALAAKGYTVFAAARRAPKVVAAERVVPGACDATDPAQVERLLEQCESAGPLAVAIYNAGAFERRAVVDTSPEDFERCWRVGCFGGFLVGRAAAQAMLARRTGTILFTGATASLRGGAGFVNLAAPKFALRALAQCMARELGPQGIHVAHVIIDGQIRSERYAHLVAERGADALLEPDAIAAAYMALLEQPRTAWTHEIDLRPWVEKF